MRLIWHNLAPLLIIGLYAVDAQANVSSGNILTNVTEQFHAQAASWATIITQRATWLFWTLGTISLVWTGGTLILRKADIGEFFAEFIRFILFFGFFLWLLRNAADIGSSIINSLIAIGADASHTGASNPSAVMDIGFNIFHRVMEQTSIWSPTDSVIGAILAGIILVCIALIAANMTIMLCSAWILLYGGIFFLGFGGSRWTSDIAINYYKSILSVAVSLMAMILMIGIAQSIITNYYNQMGAGIQVNEIATIMVVGIILLLLVHRVPGLIAGVLTGSSIGHSGIGTFSAGAGTGALGVAATAAYITGTAAGTAAKNLIGGGQAVRYAHQNAQQAIASSSAQQSSASQGGLADAMGGGTSMAAEMGKNLAAGIGGAVRQSAGNAKARMAASIGDSFFGRVASHIQQGTAAHTPQEAMPNTISGATPQDEISAFVHKKA